MIGEGRTDKIEGILRVLPGRDGRLRHAMPVVRRVVDRKRNICRRAVFWRKGVHHVLSSESFRGASVVSHTNFVELDIINGEKNLLAGIRSGRNPARSCASPI